jgi:hypothetical protein
MIIFTDDIPNAWFGKHLKGPSVDLKVIGPFNCTSIEVESSDGSKSSYPIITVAKALLKGSITLTQD